jgi:hypothetical protein
VAQAVAGVISPSITAVITGVMQAMFVTRIKSVPAVVLVVGLALGGIGAGVGLSTHPAAVARQPGAKADDGKKHDDQAAKGGTGKKPGEKENPNTGGTAGDQAGKEKQKVLTPEEAIRRMPREDVTVQFQVSAVEVTGPYLTYPISNNIDLKDGGKFTARLVDSWLGDEDSNPIRTLVMRLGIESVEHFRGKVVRVTGRVEAVSGNSFQMWVHDLAAIEVVTK